MNPLVASLGVAGFPMTSFDTGTPLAAIWKSALWVEDDVRRLLQVVYSVVPSVKRVEH